MKLFGFLVKSYAAVGVGIAAFTLGVPYWPSVVVVFVTYLTLSWVGK